MKCKICEQEAWSNTDYCPKHDLSFREKKTMYRIWDTVSNEFCNIENKLFSERFEFPTKKEAEDRVELAWQRTGKYYLEADKNRFIIKEYNMTDLHITNNDRPEAWLPVIEEIKNHSSENPYFQGIFTLKRENKPDMHIASDFIIELLKLYITTHTKDK